MQKQFRDLTLGVLVVVSLQAATLAATPGIPFSKKGLGGIPFFALDVDYASPLFSEHALPAFTSASVVVLGYQASWEEVSFWVSAMRKPPFNLAAQYNSGLQYTDAVKFLKQWTALSPESKQQRLTLIELSYANVFGRFSQPAELAYWEAKVKSDHLTFVDLITQHRKWLNDPKNRDQREAMVTRSYAAAFGRTPSAQERAYWVKQDTTYQNTVEAHRKWLYSPAGASELVDVIRRVIQEKTGKAPVDAQVKIALIDATQSNKKSIYDDLLNQ